MGAKFKFFTDTASLKNSNEIFEFFNGVMQRVPEVDAESVENLVGLVEDGPRPEPTNYGMVDTNENYHEEEAADADVNDNVDYGGKRSSKKIRKRKSRKQRRKKN